MEWTQYAESRVDVRLEGQKHNNSQSKIEIDTREAKPFNGKASVSLTDTDVLIAADVVYDVNELPSLVKTVFRLLTSGQGKIAIFATTLRNRNTFLKFQTLLSQSKIVCSTIPSQQIDTLPIIFPCYEDQPRSDVQICLMTVSE